MEGLGQICKSKGIPLSGRRIYATAVVLMVLCLDVQAMSYAKLAGLHPIYGLCKSKIHMLVGLLLQVLVAKMDSILEG